MNFNKHQKAMLLAPCGQVHFPGGWLGQMGLGGKDQSTGGGPLLGCLGREEPVIAQLNLNLSDVV